MSKKNIFSPQGLFQGQLNRKDSPKKLFSFVTSINPATGEKIKRDLKQKGFIFSTPPYTLFQAKGPELSCTLYQSGKLVIQGKKTKEFLEFYLEPEILQTTRFSYKKAYLDTTPRIGVDEAGKGDFFGPLCIAALFAEKEAIYHLSDLGVRDSKTLSEKKVIELAKQIKNRLTYHLVTIYPEKYNLLYQKFQNLNHLLAWAHVTAIEALVKKTGCKQVKIDKFAKEEVVIKALERKNLLITPEQICHGEEDLVIAAASILARESFVKGIEKLSNFYHFSFPKGATKPVIEVGKKFVEHFGKEKLTQVAKLHFKTLDAILFNSKNKEK